jgi:uncharacterized membrane protein
MSRIFGWFLLILAVAMLLLASTHLENVKPIALLFWAVIGAAAVYLIFFKRRAAK